MEKRKYCCDEFEKIIKDGYMKELVGGRYYKYVMALSELYQGPYNSCKPNYYDITFCPFCGARL